ncbi:NAD(P)-dependent dehydrogenase (short-subunit alcohol dehydrogenase family) [Crossiella equi]|uniref:NAD(P)-dependent dehydrogenase (Short-subunit alcohol dehydrogenase family) n=1 Tax=Crossiella equi TaxID=130796 RepID=A0ABS5A3Y8_9PSEU|nr:SDR family oxidoreductase [Crossiella equi]MBP2471288.1 NAD(P)-dependent dehydrogenase (short-subunit alcohol dehydrogenase family) [Crossiella equi]
MSKPLHGKIALVAGATRGAGRGIAIELGAAGATVYLTGRSTAGSPSEENRAETLEETASLIEAEGGTAIPVAVDHLDPAQVKALVERIDAERGRLDLLVNAIFGGNSLLGWEIPVWEHKLDDGLRMLRLAVDTHLITAHHALPLLIRNPGGLVVEITDGTTEYNATSYRVSTFFDLTKAACNRIAFTLGHELKAHGGTALALTPGWLRSEMMLDAYGVTEANWQDALAKEPHFAISETTRYAGRAVAALAADPEVSRYNQQSLDAGSLAKVYGFTDLDGSRPDAWRYLVEVQDPGKPADVTGYR